MAKAAAFFDVDGTLVDSTVVHPFAWYASHQALPHKSALRLARCLLLLPFYWTLDQVNRRAFNKVFFREYQGMSRNRLMALAETMYTDYIGPRIYPGGRDMLAQVRADGLTPVLVTGALYFTVAPLARDFGIEHVIANRLEFQESMATGKLEGPIVAGETKRELIEEFAAAHDIDLAQSYAYGDSFSDLPMLQAVGHPTAVHPDARLVRIARQQQWPVTRWKS